MARLRGNRSDNDLYINGNSLPYTWINGRGGDDTLHIVGNDELDLGYSITRKWRNLETIDFSDHQANISLAIDDYLLSRNGRGNLEIISIDNATLTLSAASSSYGNITVSGDGVVQLADNVDNVVGYGTGSGVIVGGTGNDTITASVAGNLLQGGSGNDTLVGNIGSDVFDYGTGDGEDTFINFEIGIDQIDLSDASIDSFYTLQQLIEDSPNGASINFSGGNSILLDGVSSDDLSSSDFVVDGEILQDYPDIITVEPGMSAEELNALIEDVPSGTTIVLADGIHSFTETIIISRDDISIKGESEAGTILHFTFPDGTGGNYIETIGGQKTYVDTFNEDALTGDNQITTDEGHGLQIGDAIYIYQPNTQEYLDENGWDNVNIDDAGSRPFREFITTIESIEGGVITLTHSLPYDFNAQDTRIFTVDLLEGVSISDFTITNNLGETNDFSFINTHPEFDDAIAINLTGTNGANINGISVIDAPSTAIGVTTSINAEVGNIFIDGSHNLGGGGNGYGIELAEAFNNSFTGLDIFNVRHSVIFSAWNAETNNTIEVLDTNRDINFHGSPDNNNSIFVFSAELEYDPLQDASGSSVWSIVSGSGSNHAETDIFNNNQVEFVYAEGSDNTDIIFGYDGGAYLNGHGSNDVLVGGDEDDILVGGRRRDTLTGNDGADIFIFNMGDDLDRITDFQFGDGGDTFVVMGNPNVMSFDDLTLTQNDDGVRVRYGSNSTVILENVQLADIDPSNFVFDHDATEYNDLWLGI